MDTGQVADLMREAVNIVIKLASPMLLLSMAVGVLLAIFQAVTQIHEQTIGFVLKLVVIISVLLLAGGWMMDNLLDFTRQVFSLIAG